MKITHSLAQLQKEHVVLELECIDRMYLNAYVPKLTTEGGIAAFCRGYLGHRFASSTVTRPNFASGPVTVFRLGCALKLQPTSGELHRGSLI